MKDFVEAGVHFKAYLSTWHAWLNNKLGGDLKLINTAADLFRHSWISLGVPADKVEFIYSDKLYDDIDFWSKTVKIAKNLTIARTTRTLEIAGRKETEAHYVSDFLYTPMQVADIFHLKVKICQLGMDQRKANVVAREIGEKIGYWKPICVHHHLLQGLEKPKVWPIPEGQEKEAVASAKMSKSKPETCIFIYDTPAEIKQKLSKAFCPEKTVQFNPILDICKYIIFRENASLLHRTSCKIRRINPIRQASMNLPLHTPKANYIPWTLKAASQKNSQKYLNPSDDTSTTTKKQNAASKQFATQKSQGNTQTLSTRLKEKLEKIQQLLTELSEESENGKLIIVEGKKDIETLRALGISKVKL